MDKLVSSLAMNNPKIIAAIQKWENSWYEHIENVIMKDAVWSQVDVVYYAQEFGGGPVIAKASHLLRNEVRTGTPFNVEYSPYYWEMLADVTNNAIKELVASATISQHS